MTPERLNEIASVLCGLKRYEWARVEMVVEKQFNAASSQLQLPDAASIEEKLKLEFFGFTE